MKYSQLDNNNQISFTINNTRYYGDNVSYSNTVQDLGITNITSVSFNNTYIESVESFPSLKNVTSLTSMFNNCYSLKSIPTFEYPSNAINCNMMFANCSSLTTVNADDLSGLKTNNAQAMFMYCSGLTNVTLPTALTTCNDLSILFAGCSNLKEFNFGTTELYPTKLNNMFAQCSNLDTFNYNYLHWDNVEDCSGMFSGCTSLQKNDLIFTNNGPTSNLKNISEMFRGFGGDLGTVYTTDVGLWHMFANANIEYADYIFADSQVGSSQSTYNDYVRAFDGIYLKSCNGAFMNCHRLNQCWLSFYSTELTSMTYMFSGCDNLWSITFDNFVANSDVDMSGMFNGCSALTSITFNNSVDCILYDKIEQALEEAGIRSQVTINGAECGAITFATQERIALIPNDNKTTYMTFNDTSTILRSSEENHLRTFNVCEWLSTTEIYNIDINSNCKHIIALPETNTLTSLTISTVDVEYLDFSNNNLNMLQKFIISFCPNLRHIIFKGWTDISNLSDYGDNGDWVEMLNKCSNLKTIKFIKCSEDVINFWKERVEYQSYDVMFITEENDNYIHINTEGNGYSIVNNGEVVYTGSDSIVDLTQYGWTSGLENQSVHYMLAHNEQQKTVYMMPDLSKTTGHWGLFSESKMDYINCKNYNFNPNNGDTDVGDMFANTNLVWADISGWDLTNAYNLNSMFRDNSNLKYIFAYGCNEQTISYLENDIIPYVNSNHTVSLKY